MNQTTVPPWVGTLPAGWRAERLKLNASVRNSNVDKKTYDDGIPVRLCNYTDVYYNEYITDDMQLMVATATPQEQQRFRLQEGDVIITKDSESWDDIGIPACVAEELDNVVCGYHLTMMRPEDDLDGRFLMRSLMASGIKEQFHLGANGVTRFGLGLQDIKDTWVPVPPIETQRRIAAFLDRKTAAIDALIAKKKRLITLLQEKRQALITHAVTKGLNPNAPMKDSGIPWIGEIPEHWDCTQLKRLATRVDVGIAEAATHAYVDEGVPLIRSKNIRPNRLDAGDLLFIDEAFAWKNRNKTLHAGDIVTVRTGYPGVSAIVPDSLEGSQCFTNLATTLTNEHEQRYVCYCLNSGYGMEYFKMEGWGTAQTNISVPILQSFPIAFPELNEQRLIADHIARHCEHLDPLVTRLQQSSGQLTEYRQALISAAVTGQLPIPEEAA